MCARGVSVPKTILKVGARPNPSRWQFALSGVLLMSYGMKLMMNIPMHCKLSRQLAALVHRRRPRVASKEIADKKPADSGTQTFPHLILWFRFVVFYNVLPRTAYPPREALLVGTTKEYLGFCHAPAQYHELLYPCTVPSGY